METNLYSCTRTGHTISEKTMEDGNTANPRDDNFSSTSLGNLYGERPAKFTTNGHDGGGESSSPPNETFEQRRANADATSQDKHPQRINPLRIHLGKRPFVDNSLQYYNPLKRKKSCTKKSTDSSAPISAPRVPKLIPKRNQFQNVSSQYVDSIDNEQDKPVPRLVPKSQLMHFKKGKLEGKGKQSKGPPMKEYSQSLGLQPMVKFKCRKCCSMSFKTLAMLKEHQLACRAQAKEPALSPEVAPKATGSDSNSGGPSRVTRKVYLCSACGTYYENWNLFLHMREKHKRHICLFCLGMFSKAERLSTHLTNKHNVKEFNYNSKEEFFNVYNGTLYLMCCECDEICSEKDDFFNHDCGKIKSIPVPLLVSKNAVKTNSVQNIINSGDLSINGSMNVLRCANDKKEKDVMVETAVTKLDSELKPCAIMPSSTTYTPNIPAINNDVSSRSPQMELDNSVGKSAPSPVNWNAYNAKPNNNIVLPNGDDSHSEESDSHAADDAPAIIKETAQSISSETVYPPCEKECGIKLKLSLNNANSPVIINSTVDPTIGQQLANKPPTRNRRPPKRYEKDKLLHSPIAQAKTPSIKMTICDRADSPFVKTTIYDNNKIETTVKTIMNNNLDTMTKSPEHKVENVIKSTIYDNKPENDEITLNRVPKLTVRVPKELLDKDSSSDYSSDSDGSDKLTVDEHNTTTAEEVLEPKLETQPQECTAGVTITPNDAHKDITLDVETSPPLNEEEVDAKVEPATEPPEPEVKAEPVVEEPTIPVTELSLNKPLDKYPLKDLLKVFLAKTVYNCIYCNHVRKIAVNCEQLSLHMVAQHRFSATVDSITAEELMPETITAKLQSGAAELNSTYINLECYDSAEKSENVQYEHAFECFQCFFKTAIHKDLCLHNRKMHQKTILLCVMCKSNYYSYSELLCHICPGTYNSEYDTRFRCCFCNVDSIPSQFRLMVHLRKIHHTCDVCLEFCHNQARLSNHVWKHKLHHFCYRCGIAYRNKLDITNHLFWKHGTESILCKKCMQKKWPHVYHFCNPPAVFACDECNLQFTKPVYLKVHKRFHSEEFPHVCTEENCSEKFVSKKLLNKHINEHLKKLVTEDLNDKPTPCEPELETPKETTPVIDLSDDKPVEETGTSKVKEEIDPQQPTKKSKKKKSKDKDALLLDVNLPALNLSESDSSDESDSGTLPPLSKEENIEVDPKDEKETAPVITEEISDLSTAKPANEKPDGEQTAVKVEEKPETTEDEKPSEQQVLDIWDNFKKYQAKVEKPKTPPLVPIRKHVCESDHDYCLVPMDMNGEEDSFNLSKKKNKKTPKKSRGGGLSSSSSSSSDSDSSCSCGSNCSCSSSSGSSSSSSSDSDSSDESGNEKKKLKRSRKKSLQNRRLSNGSNVDVMGMSETPILVPEKVEPPIAESDLETAESETDEEFYDENPQLIANKLHEEKRNQLMLLASVAPSDGGSMSGEISRPATPIKDETISDVKEEKKTEPLQKTLDQKPQSSKKKSKKKKKSKSSKKHAPIKINIPKDVIAKSEISTPQPLPPNKITISLQSNTVQIPEAPNPSPSFTNPTPIPTNTAASADSKRASKRRRVPNKFYGYSSDDEHSAQQLTPTSLSALKPQQPPKLEWRKEDLPSPVTSRIKKEIPSTILTNRLYNNYTDPIRLTAPIPDPEPPKILMNTESMESSDSDSSDEGNLEIYQPSIPPIPPPNYLNSGTSSLPYAFQRPPVREAREGESVYCYCRCPYDEVSEMIACDAEGCPIEWFHFECVGIMVPPKGKWYCPECRKNQNFSGYR